MYVYCVYLLCIYNTVKSDADLTLKKLRKPVALKLLSK